MASCIGREFAYDLLAAVSPLEESELRSSLEQLVAAELVFERGEPPDAKYVFKHALVRDAAHESLLKVKRQQLHARIAQVLEDRFPETTLWNRSSLRNTSPGPSSLNVLSNTGKGPGNGLGSAPQCPRR